MVLKALEGNGLLTWDVYMGDREGFYKTICDHSGMCLENCHGTLGKASSF